MIPIGQVNEEQKENYMTKERSKRRQFLQKFVDICSASKVHILITLSSENYVMYIRSNTTFLYINILILYLNYHTILLVVTIPLLAVAFSSLSF